MYKLSYLLLVIILILSPLQAKAEPSSLLERLSGKILLQVESYGRAWYIDPVSKQRYYLKDGATAYELMRSKGLGITNANLEKIPTRTGQAADAKLVERLKGRILLQVESLGEAWYINPDDGLRYYLKDGEVAYELMRRFSLGISNDNLRIFPINNEQLVHDTTFEDVAYVKYHNGAFSNGYNSDKILPLASLTKLMTALVLLDTEIDWNKQITITQEILDYPKNYVGDDTTSEIDLKLGDVVTAYDLWVAMLVASSNQATAALALSTDLPLQDFIRLMNDKAKQLGLTKTIFFDVAGLDAHNVTTAKEMALIAHSAFADEKIVLASRNTDHVITTTNGRTIRVVNRNYSLLNFQPEASKTGFLIEAQRTVALKKTDSIIVVMHALSMSQRNKVITELLP